IHVEGCALPDALEPVRQESDEGEGPRANQHGRTDRSGLELEAIPPERVRADRHVMIGAWALVERLERAPHARMDAEHIEEIARCTHRANAGRPCRCGPLCRCRCGHCRSTLGGELFQAMSEAPKALEGRIRRIATARSE